MGILDGKAAIVTGAGRGIGVGHALHLASNGANVVVNDIDGDEAGKTVSTIAENGGTAVANTSDISTREGARALVDQCANEFGGVHILVNNAGNVRDRSFLKMTDDDFESVLRVHVFGTFMCSQEAALRMKDQGTGGSIVNTVSAAHFGNFGQTNYAGSKGAIASMTYTWAIELARYGIRVNAISPSGTTRMSATAKIGGKVVELPFLDPERNGAFVVFLCSDDADFVTGQAFGTGGERVTLLNHPRYGTTMLKPDGWGVEDLQLHFKNHFGKQLEAVGLMKNPYPFYEGVKAPEK